MKRAVLIAAAFVAVLAGCLAGYAVLRAETALREELARAVRKATHRDLIISGRAAVELTPTFAVTFQKISLGAPADAPSEPVLQIELVRVEAEFLSLLTRHIKIRRVILQRPSLNLLVDAQGRPNWGGIAAARPTGGAAPPANQAEPISPAREGASVKQLNPVKASEHSKLLATVRELEGAGLYVENGDISYRDQIRGTDFHLTGLEMSVLPDFPSNSLDVVGVVSEFGEKLAYKVRLGMLNGSPSSGAPLAIEVAARFGSVNFNGQAALKDETGKPGITFTGSVTAIAEGIGRIAGAIEISGPAANGGALNATVRPTALTYGNVSAQGGQVSIGAEDGAVTAHFEGVGLYGGAARGDLKIDARHGEPIVSGSTVVENVAALPLLTDASRFDWLSGTGAISLTFAGTGANPAQIVKTLSGEARLSLKDGALEGLDLPRMLRSTQEGAVRWTRNPADKTPFERFAASFAIVGGVARTTDLSLSGPNVSMAGDGSVDLAREALDLRLQPRLTAAPDGSADAGKPMDFVEIPLLVRGPWAKPKIELDLNRVLADPATAAASAKTLAKPIEKLTGGAIKSEDVGKAIDALFGKKKSKQPAQAPTQPQ